MRYFVKPHFSDWREVDKEHYERFIKNIRSGATAMNNSEKEECIRLRTKIDLEERR